MYVDLSCLSIHFIENKLQVVNKCVYHTRKSYIDLNFEGRGSFI